MPVNTKQVDARRTLHFRNVREIVADAERVTSGGFHTLGNWSAGQIFLHLARAVDASIDGLDAKVSLPIRLIGRYVLKKRILEQPMSAGFQLPSSAASKLFPGETETAAGLKGLREAIGRLESTDRRAEHFVFGHFTREEWNQFHCRHAELHLSFIIPHGE